MSWWSAKVINPQAKQALVMARHPHSSNHKRPAHHATIYQDPAVVPAQIQAALKQAMVAEGVLASNFDDLLWIMAQESEGKIGVANQQGSSARGLFQLLKAQFGLYPRGEASLGNAVEECQGGISYIIGRYRSAAVARAFWEKHRWY